MFHNSCFLCRNDSEFLTYLLILLSNDINLNPGPFGKSYFTFMNWNCNSLAKGEFSRLKLLESENSVFDYDIIALCETSLSDQVKLPDNYLNNYTFISSNKPDNSRHGGSGLFYRNDLPITVRNDLSFDECVVVELNYGRKKIIFCDA